MNFNAIEKMRHQHCLSVSINNKKMTWILRTVKICDPTLPLILRYMKTETKDTNTWEEFLQTLNCN